MSVALFKSRKARIGIVGLGYVGVPLAVEFAEAGYRVLGFDNARSKVTRLNAGEDIILDVEPGSVARLRKGNRLSATSDWKRIRECDGIIICVPTPLDEHKEPDLGPVVSATEALAPYVRKGQVLVLESTTFPGTTREVLKPILEKKKLKAGRDFFLGFSPERVDPGNEKFKTKNTPKIISGLTPRCLAIVTAMYEGVIDRLVPVSSPETAEMAKLLENIFRNVNIALVNELMLLSDRMDIDIWEVIDAAATKPFGYMPFYPGPGVGGHCIPIDPFYLSWKAKEFDFFTNFITLSAEVNENIPYYVVEKTARLVNTRLGLPLKGLTVMVLGVAFKKNVDDARNTPAEKIMRRLVKMGAKVIYHDPYIPEFVLDGRRIKSTALNSAAARKAPVVIIHTDHDNVDIVAVARRTPLVIDARNATRRLGRRRNIVKL